MTYRRSGSRRHPSRSHARRKALAALSLAGLAASLASGLIASPASAAVDRHLGGQIINETTFDHMAGVTVELYDGGGTLLGSQVSAPDFSFFPLDSAGSYRLHLLIPPGYIAGPDLFGADDYNYTGLSTSFTTAVWSLVMAPATAYDVNVTTTSGAPFDGAVDVNCPTDSAPTAETVVAGAFSLTRPYGQDCTVTVASGEPLSGVTATTGMLDASGGTVNVVLATADLSGPVGEGPWGGTVDPRAAVYADDGDGHVYDGWINPAGDTYHVDVPTSNTETAFTIGFVGTASTPQYSLTPRQYLSLPLDISAPGGVPTIAGAISVGSVLASVSVTDGSDISATSGTITNTDGSPVLNWRGDQVPSNLAGTGHTLEFTDLLPGTYTVHWNGITQNVTLTSGELQVVSLTADTLLATGTLVAGALDANGHGIPGANVTVTDENGAFIGSGATDVSGYIAFGDQVVGNYIVTMDPIVGYTAAGPLTQTVAVVSHLNTQAVFRFDAVSTPTPTPVPAAGTMRLDAGLPVTRLADTRESGTMVAPGSPLRVHVAEGASAAVLQLTADGASEAGYLTAYPCTTDVPLASNVNYVTGKPSSALSTVMLTTSGDVCITSMNPVHVIVDRMAVYGAAEHSTSGRFVPVTPVRALDTRDGVTLSAGEERTISLPGIPAGATAVSINLTAVGATGGWLAAYPADTNYTGTSNLNVDNDATASSAVVVPVSADGKITLKTQNATDVIVDVMGYFTSPTDTDNSVGLFVPTHPTRVLDTRTTTMPWTAGETRTVATGVPANATAVAATVTYLADTEGYLTAWASGPMPATSNINAPANSIVPNMINVGVTNSGFQLYAQTGGHIVVDIAGYFTTPTAS